MSHARHLNPVARFASAAAATALLLSIGQATAEPDLVILGGPIYTARDDQPRTEAVAVEDGVISYVGNAVWAEALISARTTVIDLAGKTMTPGFVDSHAHLFGIGMRELTLNLEDVKSIAELVETVETRVKNAQPGEVIFGRGWIETHWPEARFPTAADLDTVSPDNPLLLQRADGHAMVVNAATLATAGIDDQTPDPEGGQILRDAAGRATGMLIDNAMELVRSLLPEPTGAERGNGLTRGAEAAQRLGWTGMHNMSVDWQDVLLLEELSDAGRIKLRVYNSVDSKGEGPARLLADGLRTSANGRIVTRAIKFYLDGALGSRGAALLEPYSDADGMGLLLADRQAVMPVWTAALKAGIQINTHAIGDRANRLLLDWYEQAFEAVPEGERAIALPRWRDEHTQIVHPDDISRFAALGIIPSMQPSHAIGDLHFAPARLGQDRLAGAYAWRSLIDAGAIIAGGSDAPVEKGDPVNEFYAATIRKDMRGFSGEGWHPEQAVSRTEALKMFTAWAAYASFQEEELGTIAVGKRADFTIFSTDIMTAPEDKLRTARAVMTIIDGEIVARSDGN